MWSHVVNVHWYNTYCRVWALPVCAAIGRCSRQYILDHIDFVLSEVEVY